jgi:signal transduction histidine kinase
MFSSLRARLWLSYAVLIAAALGLVALFLLAFLLRSPLTYSDLLERLRSAETVAARPPVEKNALDDIANEFDVRMLLFAPDGQLLHDTRADLPTIGLPPLPRRARTLPVTRDSSARLWLFSTRQLDDGNLLLTATPRPRLTFLRLFRNEALRPVFQAGGIALVLALLLAYALARWVADPLQKLLAAARALPSGSVQPVPVRGPKEVQELTHVFNDAAARLQAGRRSQKAFIANVSHDLKTPLTSIQGFAQAMLDGTADTPAARRQAAQVIYDEAGRMHRMVLDLLDLARLDAGTLELHITAVDVPALLRGVAGRFELQARQSGVSLQVETADLPPVHADGDRLAQVLTNLVDNALRHTPSGGRVTLTARPAGVHVEIEVSDTGRGIPAAELPHIFERFYRVDPSRKSNADHGAGLGLAIVSEIVAAHGGKIHVRSQLGQGTTFVVSLPTARPEASTIVRRK